MTRKKRNADALLRMASYEKLQQVIGKAIKRFGKIPCIYISLNKSWKNAEKTLAKSGIDTKRICFIDCVNMKSEADTIHVPPAQLSRLAYAVGCFIDEIKGEKFIVIDSLSTLLIYNDVNKVAGFVKAVVNCASQNNVDIIALSPATKGEELLGKIYNFFDDVKKR